MKANRARKARRPTPGPWFVNRREGGDHNVIVILGNGGKFEVATILAEPELSDEDRANAPLLAAAPDLLAACEEVLRCSALPDSWAAPVRAAVAKARGQS